MGISGETELPAELDIDFDETGSPSESMNARARAEEAWSGRTGRGLDAARLDGARALVLESRTALGGVGELWSAQQPSLLRRVAVKRVQPQLKDSAQGGGQELYKLRQREFEQEALITAHLDHPGIVPVYELQKNAEGELLLAMKMVNGRSWEKVLLRELEEMDYHDYLLKNLPILISVSHAVAFAHSKGVIHRDIKPAQVMLGAFGEVLLTDWGLAIVEERGPEREEDELAPLRPHLPSPHTATNPAGTPCMMAPEQTEITASSITRQTDIFLLGATLYYLLTGSPPHGGKSVREAYIQAMKCDIEPPKLRRPNRPIPQGLAYFAMRCMSQEPGLRPLTVQDFVDGLNDYLSGASDRRHSLELSQDAKSLLGDLGNAVSTDAYPLVKPRYWDSREKRGEDELYAQYADCLNLLDRAVAHWPQNPEVTPLRNRILGAYIWAALENGDLSLARVLLHRLEDEPRKVELEAVVDLRREEVRQMGRQRLFAVAAAVMLATILVASSVIYITRQRTSVLRAEKARADSEHVINFMLGTLRTELTSINQLEIMDKVGEEALRYFVGLPLEEAKEETLMAYAVALRQLADARVAQGDLHGARQRLAQSVFSQRQLLLVSDKNTHRHSLAKDLTAIGDVAKRQGEFDNALVYFSEGQEILSELVIFEGGRREWQLALSDVQGQIASIHLAQGRLDEAHGLFSRQLAIRTRLLEAEPEDLELLNRVATSHIQMGWIWRDAGRYELYVEELEKALANRLRTAKAHPEDEEFAADLARTYYEFGKGLMYVPRLDEAEAAFRSSLALLLPILASNPDNAQWKAYSADSYFEMGRVLHEASPEDDEGLAAYTEAMLLQEELVALDPSNVAWLSALATSCYALGSLHEERAEFSAARAAVEQSAEIRKKLLEKAPSNKEWRKDLEQSNARLARLGKK